VTDPPNYSLDDEVEAAEQAARELQEQLARLRDKVAQAKGDIGALGDIDPTAPR
jgi:hypothetical protein